MCGGYTWVAVTSMGGMICGAHREKPRVGRILGLGVGGVTYRGVMAGRKMRPRLDNDGSSTTGKLSIVATSVGSVGRCVCR